jgi:hypothetical protein
LTNEEELEQEEPEDDALLEDDVPVEDDTLVEDHDDFTPTVVLKKIRQRQKSMRRRTRTKRKKRMRKRNQMTKTWRIPPCRAVGPSWLTRIPSVRENTSSISPRWMNMMPILTAEVIHRRSLERIMGNPVVMIPSVCISVRSVVRTC